MDTHDIEKKALIGDRWAVIRVVSALRKSRAAADKLADMLDRALGRMILLPGIADEPVYQEAKRLVEEWEQHRDKNQEKM